MKKSYEHYGTRFHTNNVSPKKTVLANHQNSLEAQNFRKIIGIIEYFMLGIGAWFIFKAPEISFQAIIILSIIMILIDSILFLYEHNVLIKTKKIFLIKVRNSSGLDNFLAYSLAAICIIGLIVNWSRFEFSSIYAFLVSFIPGFRQLMFIKQKNSTRITQNKILFKDLFIRDLYINMINHVDISFKNKVIWIELKNGDIRKLNVDEEFFGENKEKIIKVVVALNHDPQVNF